MKETLKLAITLLIICMVSAAVLAFSNEMTKGKIAEQQMETSLGSLKEIFGEGGDFKVVAPGELFESDAVVKTYEAKDGDAVVGYAFEHIAKGFGGDILMLTGFSTEGELKGTRILTHGETAGIGSKAADVEFLDQFSGESINDESGVATISGATVSSSAVLSAIAEIKEIVKTNLGL